jgi:hypothetical protein
MEFLNVKTYLSMALQSFCCTLAAFSVSWSYTQSVGLRGRGISPLQGRYLHTEQRKHRINAHTDIHALQWRNVKKRWSYPCNGPRRPMGLWDVEALTFSLDIRLTVGGKVVNLTLRPPFTPPGKFLVLISVRGWVDPRAIVRLEGLGKSKRNLPHRDSNPPSFGS